MRSDTELRLDVGEELFAETRVEDEEIAASVQDGVVTVRGTVGSLGAKRAAAKAARRVAGVREVRDELDVRLLTEHRHEAAELRGSVLRLSWSVFVPDDVDATVAYGMVTLHGTVDFRHQRGETESTIRNLRGVTGIRVRDLRVADDVSERLEQAFRRNAAIDASQVRVGSSTGR